MNWRHVGAVARKEIYHIFRDPATFFLVLLTPTLLLLLMAYALTVEISNVPVAVLDHDRSPTSRRYINRLLAGSDIALYAYASTIQEIEQFLLEGRIKAAIILHPQFGRDLIGLRGVPMQIIIDGTEPETGGFAVEHIGLRTEEFLSEQLGGRLGGAEGLLTPIDLRVRTWYNPSLKPRVDLIPGLISLVLGMPALSVALTLAHEREHGTLEQLMATPISRASLLLGKMAPYGLVGLANAILIPLLAVVWFRVPINGSFPLFLFLTAIFLFAILGMGMIVGVFIRTQAAALALSFLVIFFPAFFLTGIFFPIASMPELVRLEALALPGTHFAAITRGIFLPGVGLDVLWPYAVMLLGLGAVFFAFSALFFRKRIG